MLFELRFAKGSQPSFAGQYRSPPDSDETVSCSHIRSQVQERLSVLAAPHRMRSSLLFARLRSAVPKHA